MTWRSISNRDSTRTPRVTPRARPARLGFAPLAWMLATTMATALAGVLPACARHEAGLPPGPWSATGSLGIARTAHTATLLASGKVLVAGGYANATALRRVEMYDPAAGTWSTMADLGMGHFRHAATLLSSGMVLVVGGWGPPHYVYPIAPPELYDPDTDTWRQPGSVGARVGHTVTLLPSGKALLVGGEGHWTPLDPEIYDPTTETWSPTGALGAQRLDHTATLLPSGKVLVAGGVPVVLDPVAGGIAGTGALASAEVYDPAAGTWSATGQLATARLGHTATLLPSGMVLVTGGMDSHRNALASAEVYDPATGTWSAAGQLATPRFGHTATLLPSGKVLVACGDDGSDLLASAELYDETAGGSPRP